jgi:outer membrane protein assembly factor BamB
MASSREMQDLPRAAHARTARALLALVAIVALGACGGASNAIHTSTLTPAPNAGTLYIPTSMTLQPPISTSITALATGDGRSRWQDSLPGGDIGLVFNGTTLFAATVGVNQSGPPAGGTLTAITATNGTKAWHHDYTGQVPLPLAANADAAFVAVISFSSTGFPPTSTVEALRVSDGSPLWSAPQNGSVISTAALANDTLYIVTATGISPTATTPPAYTLYALGAGDGKPLWHLALSGAIEGNAAPVISGGVLYLIVQPAPSANSRPPSTILAVKASDGTELWHTESPTGSIATQLLAGDDTVYYVYDSLSSVGGGLQALRATDGSPAWQKTSPNGGLAVLAADGGEVFTSDFSGKSATGQAFTLHAYNSANGAVVFESPVPAPKEPLAYTGGSNGLQARVVNGVLYLIALGVTTETPTATTSPSQSSIVLALGAGDGKLKWEHALNGDVGHASFYAAP